MLRRLRSMGLSLLLASSAMGVTLAAPLIVLGASCPATYWSGPSKFLDDNPRRTVVQAQVIVNCLVTREARLELELRRNGVLIDSALTICSPSSCNANSMTAVVSRTCNGTGSATFTTRYRTKAEDKFPWQGWVNGPSSTLTCSM